MLAFYLFIMKCEICKEKIEENFLDKIHGIYVKVNSKTFSVCSNCQKNFPISEIKEKLK
jgi:uncharacterized protein with PIN domain